MDCRVEPANPRIGWKWRSSVRSPNFNFSAPFDLEIAATLLIHPLLVGVAGISRAKGACLQGEVWRSYHGVGKGRLFAAAGTTKSSSSHSENSCRKGCYRTYLALADFTQNPQSFVFCGFIEIDIKVVFLIFS